MAFKRTFSTVRKETPSKVQVAVSGTFLLNGGAVPPFRSVSKTTGVTLTTWFHEHTQDITQQSSCMMHNFANSKQ